MACPHTPPLNYLPSPASAQGLNGNGNGNGMNGNPSQRVSPRATWTPQPVWMRAPLSSLPTMAPRRASTSIDEAMKNWDAYFAAHLAGGHTGDGEKSGIREEDPGGHAALLDVLGGEEERVEESEEADGRQPMPMAAGTGESSRMGDAMPITAPVPRLYASLGKAAMQSILSIGTEDEADHDEDPERSMQDLSANEQVHMNQGQAMQQQHIPTQEVNLRQYGLATPPPQSTEPPHIPPVRPLQPLTPSTIMALTDPCLFAWCHRLDDHDVRAILSMQTTQPVSMPVDPDHPHIATTHPWQVFGGYKTYEDAIYAGYNMERNAWGY